MSRYLNVSFPLEKKKQIYTEVILKVKRDEACLRSMHAYTAVFE